MQKKSFLAVLTIFLSLVFSFQIKADDIALDKAISILKVAEKNLRTVKWSCQVIPRISINDVDKVNIDNVDDFANVDHSYFVQNTVLFDVVSKRFIVEESACTEWLADGTENQGLPLSSLSAYSFDGETYSAWKRSAQGVKSPDADEYTDAQVSINANEVRDVSYFLETNGASVDFGTGFPGYLTLANDGVLVARSLSSILSEWEKKGFPISIQELSDGKWAIESKIIIPRGEERLIRMRILPQDGVVVYFSRIAQIQDKEIEELRVEVEVTTHEKQGIVPRKMYFMRPLDRMMHYTTFSLYEKNPSLTKDMFSLDFPEGCYVDDYVNKMYYKVGDIVDEDNKISQFMNIHNLTGNVPKNAKRSTLVIRCVLIGIGTLMILFALWRITRKSKKRCGSN